MIIERKDNETKKPYFEYCYCAAPKSADPKTLIVSFPGRKGNRQAQALADQSPAFLWDVLNNSNADILYIRSVYEGDYNLANMTDDYYLLPEFLYDLKEQHGIERLVLFGFSLGCELCLRLARKYVADEMVLISPSLCSVTTLNAAEGNRMQKDFDNFCNTWRLPEIEPYPQNIQVKILQGLNLEDDLLKERPFVYYLKLLIPQASVETVQGVGHHIVNFWRDQNVLQTRIFSLLGIMPTIHRRDYQAKWLKLADAFTGDKPADASQTLTTNISAA
jgi:pimeloyl-ACP methyl ester carboxylesterase